MYDLPTPDVAGPVAKAWVFDIDDWCRRTGRPRNAGCAQWLIHCPTAHPWWQYYCLCLYHLRYFEGQPNPPVIFLVGATHELILFAVDPQWKVDVREMPAFLSPANFGAQIAAADDREAVERAAKAVREVCDGDLSPDTDFINDWVRRFGGNMMRGYHNPQTN